MLFFWSIIYLLGIAYADPSCYAVSLEAGGTHGAFEAGSLWQLANTPTVNSAYNVVIGISTGSLNAGGVAQFAQGNEKAMGDFVVNTWLTLNGSQSTFVEWPGGLLEGILFQRGLLDNKPLANTLHKRYTYGINRNITIGSTDLDTGLFAQFNESLGSQGVLTAITCSACPAFFFPPTNYLGATWIDGGTVILLDSYAAVDRCLDVVAEQSQVTVDIIFTGPYYALPAETKMTTIDVYKRIAEIAYYDAKMKNYYSAMTAWPDVNFRYAIFPSVQMPGGFIEPLNFNQTILEWEVQLGKNDTANIIQKGVSGRTVLTQMYEENKKNIIYP